MMAPQVYEDYWNFTLAYTDFNGGKFIGTLSAIVSFINRTSASSTPTPSERYGVLQAELQDILKINEASIRKAINQLVKMGFINTGLKTYHDDAIPYINSHNDEQRKILLSRIVYSNASFARSVTTESEIREISFIVKTIEHNEKITKHELAAIMRMEVGNEGSSFASSNDIEHALADSSLKGFEERKYNQISYLWNLLQKLDGITSIGDESIRLVKEHDEISDEHEITETKGRDNYLQSIYKRQLKNEVLRVSGKLECMVNRLDYPNQMYIASHIKPYRSSNSREAYDPNNGLLLSLNVDKFFDAGLISFKDDGEIIISKRLNKHSKDLHDYLLKKTLGVDYINDSRKEYLAYHRKSVFN